MPDIQVINIAVRKDAIQFPNSIDGCSFALTAWSRLFERYEHALRDVQSTVNRLTVGMIMADATDEKMLRTQFRRMRKHNLIQLPNQSAVAFKLDHIIEDPIMRDSQHSYFVRTADLCAHALYRHHWQKGRVA